MNDQSNKYRAPALEKGLDILELLSSTHTALTSNEIALKLDRSKAELYRMLQVLEARGYVEKLDDVDGYIVTNKLLALGTERQPISDLFEYSLPLMRALADDVRQSCHMAVRSGSELVVIARVEAPGSISYAVRVGYKRPFVETASGRVIFTYQTPEQQSSWLNEFELTPSLKEQFLSDCKTILKAGHWSAQSEFVRGVTDVSLPIKVDGLAIAALTIPFIERVKPVKSLSRTIKALHKTADSISAALQSGFAKSL